MVVRKREREREEEGGDGERGRRSWSGRRVFGKVKKSYCLCMWFGQGDGGGGEEG